MWKYKDIDQINIEVSSLCNSICAWCPRYENMSSLINKQLTPTYVTLEQFKDWFPTDFIAQIDNWAYSGDYGDAGTNPDLLQIFEYTFKYNPEASVEVNTNGGMKTPKFWYQLGKLFSERKQRKVIFSIDGLEDTNHIYRRNVKWHKVLENASAFLEAGGEAYWDFLIFKHNQHQVEEVLNLADKMGFKEVRVKYPQGFDGGNMQVRDKELNVLYEIEPISPDYIKDTHIKLNGAMAEDISYDVWGEAMETRYIDEEGEINCYSMRSGTEIRVMSDGMVYPCVHFGHLSMNLKESQQILKAQMIEFFKEKHLSLKNKTLKEILSYDPFSKIYNSWDKKSCLTCWLNCGSKPIMQQIYKNEGKIYGTT